MGKKSIVETTTGLQFANGVITYPMGLIEGVQVKICGIDFDHTFVVVDFK